MLTTVVQCSHCKADLNPDGTCPNGGRHLYTQATRTKAQCPLCGGPLHHNDAAVVMDFRCAWRQFSSNSGAKELDLTPSHVQEFAAWFTQAPRRYGATLAAQELAASGATFKVVEKATKKGKGNAASAAALPVPQPTSAEYQAEYQRVATLPQTQYPPVAPPAPYEATCTCGRGTGTATCDTCHAPICARCATAGCQACAAFAAPAPVAAAPAEPLVDAREIMAAMKRELGR